MFVRNRHTGEERRINRRASDQTWPGDFGRALGLAGQSTRIAVCKIVRLRIFDIYSYNLKTSEERPLTQTSGYNGPPSVHGQRVTWEQFREGGGSVIVLLDLETGEQTIIRDGGRGGSNPLISEDYVVWAVAEPCDVFTIPPGKAQTGVYAHGLKTGEVRQLSDYVEPMVLLHANVAVIAEVCFGVRRQYAIHLD